MAFCGDAAWDSCKIFACLYKNLERYNFFICNLFDHLQVSSEERALRNGSIFIRIRDDQFCLVTKILLDHSISVNDVNIVEK